MIVAYIAPEVVLPLTSALTAVVGVVMLVGRAPIRYAKKGLRAAGRGVRPVVRAGTAPFRLAARGVRGLGRGVRSVADKLQI